MRLFCVCGDGERMAPVEERPFMAAKRIEENLPCAAGPAPYPFTPKSGANGAPQQSGARYKNLAFCLALRLESSFFQV
jgi:hypothetical protein